MAATSLYCGRADITRRLSETGVLYAANDSLTGDTSEVEIVASVDQAILEAGAEIDAALTPFFNVVPLPQDDSSRNQWLKDRAIDLCMESLLSRRGADPPEYVIARAERARRWLDQVRTAELRVPGLTYPEDGFTVERRLTGLPRIVNPTAPGHHRYRRGCR